jgi:Kef-type K+ transport system membrane component KefB
MELAFLRSFLHNNSFIAFGAMLLVGLVGGQLAHGLRYFPRITGYILIGFLLGPHVIGILTQGILDYSQLYAELAIGLILFELGLQLNFKELLANSSLFWIATAQSLLVFALIFFGLSLFHTNPIVAALAAAVGVSVSPAVTLLIANEYGVQGIVVKQSLILTALNNIMAFLLYAVVVSIAEESSGIFCQINTIMVGWLFPFYRVIGSILLAYLLGILIIGIGRFVGKKENLQFILLVGMLVIALGTAKLLYVSPFLTMLIFGIVTTNLDRKQELLEVELGYMGEIFFVILFVAVGANLHIHYFTQTGWLVLLFILLRSLGNTLPIFLLKNKIPLNPTQSLSLGITLFPMAGTAIALLGVTEKLASWCHESLSLIILPAVALLEIIGPMTTVAALRWIGELKDNQKLDH